MRRVAAMLAVGLAIFLVVFLIYFPAGWLMKMLPVKGECVAPAGSVWRGSCERLTIGGIRVGQVDWTIHASALLRMKLAADVHVVRPDGTARGALELGTGQRIAARDLEADLALDPALIPGLPANWQGRLQARLSELRIKGKRVENLRGTLQARDIIATGSRPAPFGSYELAFPDAPAADGTLNGKLRDIGGPISLEATATMKTDGNWQIDGLIAARPEAPEGVQRQLQYLGSPDASGRRVFSVAGTL